MLTDVEELCFNLLSDKRGIILKPLPTKRKETRDETYRRLLAQVNKNEAIKKIYKISCKKVV